MTSYWWKSSDGNVIRLSDDPKDAYKEFKAFYIDDPGGMFGILFSGGAKLHIKGDAESDEARTEVFDTVAAWIKFAEDK